MTGRRWELREVRELGSWEVRELTGPRVDRWEVRELTSESWGKSES
ncbi:conserved protein of unknown function [Limnospira indica PCC 8005]|uniref:Uncharacterized protein n=1 Tax=Limnospira indica PCC 8005 TaxID=376219 RepID=A0A9P1P0Q0_9CYAN|nr:conserved protein of unknown function [Limnospira indica PCC 8005]